MKTKILSMLMLISILGISQTLIKPSTIDGGNTLNQVLVNQPPSFSTTRTAVPTFVTPSLSVTGATLTGNAIQGTLTVPSPTTIITQTVTDGAAATVPSNNAVYDWANSTFAPIGASTSDLDPVISISNTPPISPSSGDRYLIGTSPTGTWATHSNNTVEWNGSSWVYAVPILDNVVYVTNTLSTLRYNGTSWITYAGTAALLNGNSPASNMVIGTNNSSGFYLKQNNTNRLFIGSSANVSFLNFRLNNQVSNTVPYLNVNKDIISSTVTPTELSYLGGVTSSIQDQINAIPTTGVQSVNGSFVDNTDPLNPYIAFNKTDNVIPMFQSGDLAESVLSQDVNGYLTAYNPTAPTQLTLKSPSTGSLSYSTIYFNDANDLTKSTIKNGGFNGSSLLLNNNSIFASNNVRFNVPLNCTYINSDVSATVYLYPVADSVNFMIDPSYALYANYGNVNLAHDFKGVSMKYNGNQVATTNQLPVLTGSTGITVSGTTPNYTISATGSGSTTTISAGTNVSVTGTAPSYTISATTPTITGAGIAVVSGSYPNYTVTATQTATPSQSLAISGQSLSITGANTVVIASPTITAGSNASVTTSGLSYTVGVSASPTFTGTTLTGTTTITGTVTAPTQTVGNSSGSIATTSFVTTGFIAKNTPIDYFSSSTIVGWTGTPTGSMYYIDMGLYYHVYISISGTAAAGVTTCTLPFNSSISIIHGLHIVNNSTAAIGRCQISAASNVVTFSPVGGGNFAGTLTKSVNVQLFIIK